MTYQHPIGNYWLAYTDNLSDKQPMVFVHGLPTSKELFTELTKSFSENYRTITVDLLDYGESSKIGRHIEHKERAQNLKLFFENLQLVEIVLVVHDLGASVAMDVLAICPKLIDKLVIMSPPVYPDFKMPLVVKIVRSKLIGSVLLALLKHFLLKRSIKKGLYNQSNYKKYLQAYLEKAFAGKEGHKALLRNLRWGRPETTFADYPGIIKSITQPTLVIQGEDDPYIPIEHAKRLAEDIQNSKLILLENASHFLPIDEPDKIIIKISEFLATKP
jgi:pimeloyl-ACP methyl ester carboxylesterase